MAFLFIRVTSPRCSSRSPWREVSFLSAARYSASAESTALRISPWSVLRGGVEPGLELDHLRVVGPVDLALLLEVGLDLGIGRPQGLDGRVVDGLGQGVDAELLELAVGGFLGVALDLGRGQGRVHVGELVDDRALVVAEVEEVLLLAVLLEVLLLALEVLAEQGDLLGQELRGLLGRLVAGLHREADELLDQGVDDVGGQGGVRRDVADVDEPRLGDGRDAQPALDGEGVAGVGRRRGAEAALRPPSLPRPKSQRKPTQLPQAAGGPGPGVGTGRNSGRAAEVELLGHPLGQGPAGQEAELGVEIGAQ